MRASDGDRDAAERRLKDAFVAGALDDEEFDQRMRTALVARTQAELEPLLADLPVPATPSELEEEGWLVAFHSDLERAGRWRLRDRTRTLALKGSYRLDLRGAELAGPVTTVLAYGYKSTIDLVVPPGMRVQLRGNGYKSRWVDVVGEVGLPPDAPLVRVKGLLYKSTVRARAIGGPVSPPQLTD
jgi:hypothetical protein